MRLSAYVNQHGIDAFNAEDLAFVGHHANKAPDGMILVGGQALETWGIFFDVLAPTGDKAPLTEDADWLCNRRDAIWLCERLGKDETELKIPSIDDNTPSTALAYLRRPDGRVLLMDFLRVIVGPSNEEIERLAVPVKFGSATINVLHPLLCLESRMANLAVLESKRQGNGPMQAEWAVNIAKAYLERRGAGAEPDQIAQDCRHLVELSEYKHGKYCWIHYGIDPLKAISADALARAGEGFMAKEWPRLQYRVASKRAKWDEQARRTIQQIREAARGETLKSLDRSFP
jgi:hypothetical protein